jgi:hypothetical protein
VSGRSASELARRYTDAAVTTVAQIMSDPFAEDRDRLAAARDILDRGHGKPLNTTVSVPASKRQAEQIAAMSDGELLEAVRAAPLPKLRHDAADAYYEVVPARDPLLD